LRKQNLKKRGSREGGRKRKKTTLAFLFQSIDKKKGAETKRGIRTILKKDAEGLGGVLSEEEGKAFREKRIRSGG